MTNEFHLAIIPDGNRRWAKLHGKSVPEGHKAGIDKLKDVVEWCRDLGVTTLSIWIFSTENAGRSRDEVEALFRLFEEVLDKIESSKELEQLRTKARVRFIGQLSIFPKRIVDRVKEVEAKTNQDSKYTLAILCGYGGRQEIVDAANRIADDARNGKLDKVDEKAFASYLYAPDVRDPDLVFRSAGEKRLSGLLPWQTTYSEFYFCEKLWPDVNKEDLNRAINE
ncbi:Tritrans,polycis-undecaprenyl-diphosphate synthase (GGDP specific) [uncultured archaeon]|nr:Tritrans,polycis-undecaprenyl-diphosphate synthase (GGDP specific) [uncultured archaeon]